MGAAGADHPVGEEIGRVETLAVVAQPLVWAGIGRRFPWALVGLEEEAKIGWGIVAVLLLLLALPAARWLRATERRREAVRRYAVILVLLCPLLTAGFDFLSSRHFARFGYAPAGPLLALDAAVLLGLVLWIRSPGLAGRGVVIAALAAAAHRLGSAILYPLDPRRSDMFEVLEHAARVWTAGGEPYAATLRQGLKYLPGTWLAQVPAVLLKVDPRIPAAFVLLGIGLALARSLRRGGGSAARAGLAELLTMLVLLNPYHAFRHDLYFDVFLALSAAIFHLGARREATPRRLFAMGVLVGLALATRQWAWVYGPFALLAAASSHASRGAILRRLLFASAIAALVVAAMLAPFLLQDWAAFWKGAFAFVGESFSEVCLGVAGLAAALGAARLLPFLQATVCVAGFGRALRARAESVLATGWLVWAAVVMLSPFLENYFYLSLGFAAAACSVGARRV
jgi:hypothetical protein